MKVAFKLIKTGSGNDVYFQNLAKGLRKAKTEVAFYYYPKICQFFPLLMKFFHTHTDSDIVHANIEYAWAVKEHNKPLVATVHHLVFDKEYQKFTTLSQKIIHYLILWPNTFLSVRVADKIIAVSHYTLDALNRCFGNRDKSVMIYNGIDLDVFKSKKVKPYNDGKFHLLFVGNLIKRKGSDLLPKIMERLGDKYILHYTSGLRSKPPKGFDLPNMIPLGKLTQNGLVKAYNKCDALLFPTRLEGFGYAVVEAIACNMPVLCTDNSSMKEIIKSEYLCSSNVNNIAKYITSGNLQLASNVHTDVYKYLTIQHMTNMYLSQYISVI